MLNPNFFLEHHEFYRQNYIKWKIKNLPTDPRKLLKVYRKQDYSFDWPYLNQCCHIVNWILPTNFSEILIWIHNVSLKKMHLKMLSAIWKPFCLCLNVYAAVVEVAGSRLWHLDHNKVSMSDQKKPRQPMITRFCTQYSIVERRETYLVLPSSSWCEGNIFTLSL